MAPDRQRIAFLWVFSTTSSYGLEEVCTGQFLGYPAASIYMQECNTPSAKAKPICEATVKAKPTRKPQPAGRPEQRKKPKRKSNPSQHRKATPKLHRGILISLQSSYMAQHKYVQLSSFCEVVSGRSYSHHDDVWSIKQRISVRAGSYSLYSRRTSGTTDTKRQQETSRPII